MTVLLIIIAVVVAALAYYFVYGTGAGSNEGENAVSRRLRTADSLMETEDKGGASFPRSQFTKTSEPLVEPNEQVSVFLSLSVCTSLREEAVTHFALTSIALHALKYLEEVLFVFTCADEINGFPSRILSQLRMKTAEQLVESSDQERQAKSAALKTAEALPERGLQHPLGLSTAEPLVEGRPTQSCGLKTAEALMESRPQTHGLKTAEALRDEGGGTSTQPFGLRTAEPSEEVGPQFRRLRTAEALADGGSGGGCPNLRTAEALAGGMILQSRGLRTAEALTESRYTCLRTAEELRGNDNNGTYRGLKTAEAMVDSGLSQSRGLNTAEALAKTGGEEKLRLLRTAEALVESGSSKLCGLKTAEALPQSGVEAGLSQSSGLQTAESTTSRSNEEHEPRFAPTQRSGQRGTTVTRATTWELSLIYYLPAVPIRLWSHRTSLPFQIVRLNRGVIFMHR
uniref:Transmembrane protein n=1 Tax=Ascaris lumbricoides TaxID=6252 RepID=A0A9J2PKQ9_ASCLU